MSFTALHRTTLMTNRTTHLSFHTLIGAMTGQTRLLPTIHTCYYSYRPNYMGCDEHRRRDRLGVGRGRVRLGSGSGH